MNTMQPTFNTIERLSSKHFQKNVYHWVANSACEKKLRKQNREIILSTSSKCFQILKDSFSKCYFC